MPIETKDLVGWAVTGTVSTASLLISWLNRRDAMRRAKATADQIWQLHASRRENISTAILMNIVLDEPSENRFTLNTITVIKPCFVRVALARVDVNQDGVGFMQVTGDFKRTIIVDRDLKRPFTSGFDTPAPDEARLYFFATTKPSILSRIVPSAILRKKRLSLVISAKVSEISASRRSSRIKMTSDPIDWTVRSTAKVT